GANVTGLDLSVKVPFDGAGITCGNAIYMPFAEGNFDLILCISLIEHIRQPEDLLKELIRVMKPGGSLYISFPPFCAPNGGHHFSPYHLLGEKTAVALFQKRKWHVD
ncbi:MAG: class I SAM-dependent methyltransferase, partial [Anaerolineaceae bacterium]|nr:class I SAM-dependent methyltransferase [Anaerolineaceae bacterium]